MTDMTTGEPSQSRVILTNCVHGEPYSLDGGYSLRAVKATDKMLVGYMEAGASLYWALMALPYFDVSSYNVYRDLVIFHSGKWLRSFLKSEI